MEYAGPIIGIVLFLVFIVVFARMLVVGAASRHWPKVRGTVRKVAIETRSASGQRTEYSAYMRYEYMFQGRTYMGRLSMGGNIGDRAEAERNASAYAVGQQLDVSVDGKNPRRTTLEPGLKFRYFFWLTFSVGMLIFFLLRLAEVLPQ